MPIHHGGFPGGCDDDRPALADRGDAKRGVFDSQTRQRAIDAGPRYEEQAYGGARLDDDLIYEFPAPSLTFNELQQANRERGKAWGKGLDISYLFNACELGGEAGELVEACIHAAAIGAAAGKTLNACKKFYRGEIGIAGGVMDMTPIEEELGDVVICCSLLASKLGIDLGKAVAAKFNKTSEKHGFPHRLAA